VLGNALRVCSLAAILCFGVARNCAAQQELYHPGETYDSLEAGRDAHLDAEAQRRAMVGRQLLIEDQIIQQNTWADPQARYLPVHPESYGPILPKYRVGPTLADVYAYPPADGGPVYYGGAPPARTVSGDYPVRRATGDPGGRYAAPVPVFQPWPQVPNDIYGAPYYGYVRQPIGHVKIWTSRLGYIYKPIYASPPAENPRPGPAIAATTHQATVPAPHRALVERGLRGPGASVSTGSPDLPPPPRPAIPPFARPETKPGEGPALNPPKPAPPQAGQEL